MSQQLKWRGLIILLVLCLGLMFLMPSLTKGRMPNWWSSFLPDEPIHLGLDLQGGMHLVLEVETQAAVNSSAERLVQELKETLRDKKIPFAKVDRPGDGSRLEVVFLKEEMVQQLTALVGDRYQDLQVSSTSADGGRYTVNLEFTSAAAAKIKQMAAEQALQTIRNRIDEFGVSEPEIAPQADDRILIQLPGVQDPARAKGLIGRTAQLEFKMVDEANNASAAETSGKVPTGDLLLYQYVTNRETGKETKRPYLVKKRTVLTGRYITDARVQIDNQFNEPYVTVTFDSTGARLFEQITGANVNKRMAIILDGKVSSAPTIQEKIGGGTARITGSFTMDEARDLAIVLRAGALPAPVKILYEQTVGPSLGADSIKSGFNSMIVGGLLVILFMVIYYRVSGLVADLTLVLNVIMIMGGLAAFQATLTLPGIAGIILTIGMAVDANVIIYERIREEVRLGKTPKAAVEAGFEKATWTILDANVTTLIAALVLFQFGSGPVRGFAVTLSLGIVATLFAALIFSRFLFDYLVSVRRISRLSI